MVPGTWFSSKWNRVEMHSAAGNRIKTRNAKLRSLNHQKNSNTRIGCQRPRNTSECSFVASAMPLLFNMRCILLVDWSGEICRACRRMRIWSNCATWHWTAASKCRNSGVFVGHFCLACSQVDLSHGWLSDDVIEIGIFNVMVFRIEKKLLKSHSIRSSRKVHGADKTVLHKSTHVGRG